MGNMGEERAVENTGSKGDRASRRLEKITARTFVFCTIHHTLDSEDSTVTILAKLRAEQPGVRFLSEEGIFSLSKRFRQVLGTTCNVLCVVDRASW